jgi:dihydroorotate dehydrogenase (fumarate)
MSTLNTNYMGINLKNPIIVGASNLVTDLKILKQLEEAGASAIVYKSLFEEQIQLEAYQLDEALTEYYERNAEMTSLFPGIEHAGPEEYLLTLEKAVKSVTIPVFGSLNAVSAISWLNWAKKIEGTGVAGIELNFYAVPRKFEMVASTIEDSQIEILKSVRAAIKIPIAVKLSPFYTNPLNIISKLDNSGADGFVLFNNLFQPDIDIITEKHHYPYSISSEDSNRLPLRFAGLLHGNINASVCSNTGILEGGDVIKMLLAGADCVQVVSTLYKNGPKQISKMLKEIETWMAEKNYLSIDDFKGKLSQKNLNDPYAYKRAQYIDIIMHSDNIFKKYPVV